MGAFAAALLLLVAAPGEPAPPGDATALLELVPKLSASVEEIRGLKFQRPVAVKLVTNADARSYFVARARKSWPEEKARLDQKLYSHLGLLPDGFDLLSSLLDVLEEQALGYYDPGSDTFFIVAGGMPVEIAPMLMAHELTHALDDQHFGIDRMLEAAGDDDDRSSAVAAVVEGSGTLVMTSYLMREVQAGRMTMASLMAMQQTEAGRAQRLMAAPPVIQRSLLASYVLGMSFLLRGNAGRLLMGVKAEDLNQAFGSPPRSSEQILHAEKYWEPAKRDEPRTPALPDLSGKLGPGFALASRGTLGELVLASMTGDSQLDPSSPTIVDPARWTNPAAAGLGGDAYHLYLKGERSLTVVATLWDSAQDATEFQEGLKSVPRKRSFRFGDAVVLVLGDGSGGDVDAVGAAALSAIASPP